MPFTEREELVKALNRHDDVVARCGKHVYDADVHVVVDAARAHLATLPKPEPKFRVVAVLADGCGRYVSPNGLRETALNLASERIRTGKYNSVAVEQVSS